MTQSKKNIKKIAELNSIFLSLNSKGQNNALNVLRALEFAQTVMFTRRSKKFFVNKNF